MGHVVSISMEGRMLHADGSRQTQGQRADYGNVVRPDVRPHGAGETTPISSSRITSSSAHSASRVAAMARFYCKGKAEPSNMWLWRGDQ